MARDIRLETSGPSVTLSCAVVADDAGLPDRLWFRVLRADAALIDEAGSRCPYADRRACDLWRHTRSYARELGRTEIVKAIETAMARFERSEYRALAPLAAVLSALGVTADHLRAVKRRLIRRPSGLPSRRDRPGEG